MSSSLSAAKDLYISGHTGMDLWMDVGRRKRERVSEVDGGISGFPSSDTREGDRGDNGARTCAYKHSRPIAPSFIFPSR